MSDSNKPRRRVFQACISCRERRVKCDRGPADAPHHGPCRRCRRERKPCYFTATRGRKKSTTTTVTADGSHVGEFALHDQSSTSLDGLAPQYYAGRPGGRLTNLTRPSTTQHGGGGDTTAATLLRDPAYTSHDALKLLFEAGRQSEVSGTGGHHDGAVRTARTMAPSYSRAGDSSAAPSSSADNSDDGAPLQPYSNLRFVRTGLFTAEEALDLINYFHTHLAPFTPISSSLFQERSMHATLLEDEPVLAVTILTLASRYMKLSGPGAVARSYMIHERLWQHLQGMISRMIFGQEQFIDHGNGPEPMTAAAAAEGAAVAGSSFGSLRTLGTCEALLLLSEWHPRSLHVPAADDGDSIVVRDEAATRRTRATTTTGMGGRIRLDWLEPVWRSDRMCWSMLGNALALAVELGIFDEYDNTTIGARESRRDIWNNTQSSQRAYRVQHLLWVYLTQTSGRLGWKNLTTVSVSDHEARATHGDTMRCWVGVATLMKWANELLFPSRARTREIIDTGEYVAVLRMLNPRWEELRAEFDRAKLSRQMRAILEIEFGYVRAYINSVGLQAQILQQQSQTAPTNNEEFVAAVVTAARAMLHTVVDELEPFGGLQHIPIRTYSRVLAGAMFCLKAFALGGRDGGCLGGVIHNEVEGRSGLALVERAASALREAAVDDVHLSGRFGELLRALAESLAASPLAAAQPPQQQQQQPQHHQQQQPHHQASQPMPDQPDAQQPPAPLPPQTPPPAPLQESGMLDSNGPGAEWVAADDPLLSFAGWTGGPEVFDLVGGLLDVQYEVCQ